MRFTARLTRATYDLRLLTFDCFESKIVCFGSKVESQRSNVNGRIELLEWALPMIVKLGILRLVWRNGES